MANGNQQRCCVLGVCCPPGGEAQQAAMRAWLLEKLALVGRAEVGSVDLSDKGGAPTIDQWLDELFTPEDPAALSRELGDDG